MHAFITTKALSTTAYVSVGRLSHLAYLCHSSAIIAGHKISLAIATFVLPAIKIVWVKCLIAFAHTSHFVGICKTATLLAGHKIGAAIATSVLPAIKLAWIKLVALSLPALQPCQAVAISACHKLSIALSVHILPTVQLVWTKFVIASAPVAHFLVSPLGLCAVSVVGGALITTIGKKLVLKAHNENLAGDENKVVRRITLTAGIALGVVGISMMAAGAIGGLVILL